MKIFIAFILVLTCFGNLNSQNVYVKEMNGLKMETQYSSADSELGDILSFEGIDYMKLKFSGDSLKGKGYHLTMKEIWDGKIIKDSTIINSRTIGIKQFETLSDTIFKMTIISKIDDDGKIKMTFRFPRISLTKKIDAIDSDDYSLRNLADESSLEIGYDKKFYLLSYTLPHEREDGSKSWCEVGTSGRDVENWGDKFGIKHYLIFEMKFE